MLPSSGCQERARREQGELGAGNIWGREYLGQGAGNIWGREPHNPKPPLHHHLVARGRAPHTLELEEQGEMQRSQQSDKTYRDQHPPQRLKYIFVCSRVGPKHFPLPSPAQLAVSTGPCQG